MNGRNGNNAGTSGDILLSFKEIEKEENSNFMQTADKVEMEKMEK